MKVTLTFDNGPTAEVTPQVLRSLDRHGVRATFFVLGRQMADPALRGLAVEAHAAGHRIGNHSYNHATPFGLCNGLEAVAEIRDTEALIGSLASEPKLFRPFGGGGGGHIDSRLLNPLAVDHLQRQNYTVALWTSVPRDWEDPEGWVDRALAECAREPWSVVVLHDLPTGAMDGLDGFLETLRASGAEFSQDFPTRVTPIRGGVAIGDVAAITSKPEQADPGRKGE